MNGKRLDILVLIAFIVVDIAYGYFMKGTFLGRPSFVGIVGLVPAIIYLGLRKKKNWKKIALATILFGGIFGFVFEFRVDYTHTYIVNGTILPTLFGFLQLDNVLGHMMMACLTIVFYEHFVERDLDPHISKNLIFGILPSVTVALFLVFAYYFHPSLLHRTGYTYFEMGLAAIVPPILLGFFRPRFIRNMAETAIFFFFLYLAYELLAVRLGYWFYPGNNYVGWVTLFGTTFPIEEMLFWMLFYAASLVSYYELFIDVHPAAVTLKRRKKRK